MAISLGLLLLGVLAGCGVSGLATPAPLTPQPTHQLDNPALRSLQSPTSAQTLTPGTPISGPEYGSIPSTLSPLMTAPPGAFPTDAPPPGPGAILPAGTPREFPIGALPSFPTTDLRTPSATMDPNVRPVGM
ncbi:MAG: hypothetical protein KIT87_24815 [Anaerolineae bacterium]|nr:hypothetical protein [Anaerolineae bacterium]